MRMQKRKFRIGEFAKTLNVERFVIRFWEKEFNLKTDRSHGGQRFYSEDDLATFTEIKELLYKKGFTIAGAKKQMLQGSYTEKADKMPDTVMARVFGSKKTELLSEPGYQPSQKSENRACTDPDHQYSGHQYSDQQAPDNHPINQSISQEYIQELTEQLTAQIRRELTQQYAEQHTSQHIEHDTEQLAQQIKQDMTEQFARDMADKLAEQAALFKAEKAELVRQLAEVRAHLQKLQVLFIK